MDFSNEGVLVEALRAGNDEAYNHLVKTQGDRLQAVTLKIVGNVEDAQDAVQDALLAVFKAIHTFSGKSLLSTWVHRIAVNSALMKLRKDKRRPAYQLDEESEKIHDGGDVNPATIAERREIAGIVRRTIPALKAGYRDVVTARELEGFTTREAAVKLGLTEGAVKTRLHRAKAVLRRDMDPALAS